MSAKKIIALFIVVILMIPGANVSANGTTPTAGSPYNFVDVTDQYSWAKEAINSFSTQGIVSGVGNNKFAPGAMVTREQFTKMLALTFNVPIKSPSESTFSDVQKTS